MNTRPILFKAEMVRAILAGTKTETRRLYRARQPEPWEIIGEADDGKPWPFRQDEYGEFHPIRCHLGIPGDRLWVKETFSMSALSVYPCPPAWYRADFTFAYDDPAVVHEHLRHLEGPYAACFACVAEREGPFRWKSPISMPRKLSRIELAITKVRFERLQDIRAEGVAAEGIDSGRDLVALWDSINGAGSWTANPYVWVLEFWKTDAPVGR